MADSGRLQPFAIVSFRPGTAIHGCLGEGPLTVQKTVVQATLLETLALSHAKVGVRLIWVNAREKMPHHPMNYLKVFRRELKAIFKGRPAKSSTRQRRTR